MNTLTQLFDWLLAASLRASLLTLATLIIQAALHRHLGARMRYALWLPVLIVLLMPVFPQSQWSIEHVFQAPPQPSQSIPVAASPWMVDSAPDNFESIAPMPESINWQHIFLITWACVSAGMLALGGISFMLTLRHFERARHPASDELLATLAQIARALRLRHIPSILISPAISSPAVTGLLRPTLLLPAQFDREFTPAEARLVLKHELMHLKRGDLPLNALMCVLMALHWFNPLLWVAFFKIRADREAACDAQVLHNAPYDHRIEYGHALLKVETAFCPRGFSLGFVGIFQRGSALRSRIQLIATHRNPHPAVKATITLCILLMTFLGITRAQQPQPDEDAQLIAIEMKIIKFKKATDWNFGGRLPAEETLSFNHAMLSPEELEAQLRDVMKSDDVKVTSYPRIVTASEKEVVVKSIVNVPLKNTYLPIGLVCKLTPSLHGVQVGLNIDITDSDLIDPATGAVVTEFKGDYPTARSRVYNASHETRGGQCCVIAGWENGKPQSKLPLIYVITPHVINPTKGGLPADINLTRNFAVGKSAFRPGDSIIITSMTRSAEVLTVGLDYELASAEKATAALYFTSKDNVADGKSPSFDERQHALVKRGRGSVVLHHPLPSQGLPHVTFYDTTTHHPFGGIYFGTAAEAAQSQTLNLSYMTASAQSKTAPPIDYIRQKLEKIIIPHMQFQGATVAECIAYLRAKSHDLDKLTADPNARGVNILYRPGDPPSDAAISLDFKEIPLGEALRYVVELASLQMSIQPNAVVIAESLPGTAPDTPEPTPVMVPASSKIIFPSIEFRDATLTECIDFLRIKSRDLDPDKKGVNIIVKPGGDASARITLSLKGVPLSEALRYCAELANHKLTFDAQSYFITPVSATPPPDKDQASSSTAQPPPSAAAAMAAELRQASPHQYDFDKAKLGDVLRFIATDAGIEFYALPDDNPINQKLVTFNIRSSPFSVLETLCWANGLIMVFDHAHWLIREATDADQFMQTYRLPKTKADTETILKDISSLLGGSENNPVAESLQTNVVFKQNDHSFHVKATRLQHTWVSAYFKGLSSSAQSGNTK